MRQKLGEMLIQAGLIDQKALQTALADQMRWGKPLGRTLVEMRLVNEDEMLKVLAAQLGLNTVDLDAQVISKPVLDLVPITLVNQHGLLPFAVSGKFLDVAMTDPMNLGVIDELRIRTQLNIRSHLVGWQALERALAKYHGGAASANPAFETRMGPSRGRVSTRGPESIPLEEDIDAAQMQVETTPGTPRAMPTQPSQAKTRDKEIDVLQERISKLEALVERDEAVLRKLLALLIDKGITTRDEIMERLA